MKLQQNDEIIMKIDEITMTIDEITIKSMKL